MLQKIISQNRFFKLNQDELDRLLVSYIPVGEVGQKVQASMKQARDLKFYQLTEFDRQPFPMEDMTDIIRCVHEGICPTCGRRGYLTSESTDSEWDWARWTIECVEGHKHVAEPDGTGNDWVGW